jgi:hypothetical protein
MAAVRKHRGVKVSVDYDRDVDVLYVAIGKPRPAEGEDRPRGVVYRYAMDDDAPCGVTIVGFRRNGWHEKLGELARFVAAQLGAEPEQVAALVRESTAAG